jgi:CBS domain containing-hemolysin-like protein
MIALVAYVSGALLVSFVCSLLEATLLSVRPAELAGRRERGDRGATLLLALKEERLDDAIGAILTLNTIAHTIGAALAGAQAADVFGDAWVGAFSAVLTVLILVLTEIVPKTLGTLYASQLVPFVAYTILALTKLLAPILFATRSLTRLLGSDEKRSSVSRDEVAAMVAIATEEGTLGHADSRVLTNILRSSEIKVEDVMTPRTVVRMLPADATIQDLLDDHDTAVHSRIPVYEGNRDNVLGLVLQREILSAVARGTSTSTPLRDFLRPANHIPEWEPIGNLLRRLIENREHLALATDEYGGISGLVTQEDLVETLLGIEIVDEYDRVEDLQAEARRLRDLRLRQLGETQPPPD